ncbi:MAG: hypothetical protein CL559_00620 [Alphaproteobacteria bacterium]|nr:hypothetical protein [Alphaproteobacteria bacterium]
MFRPLALFSAIAVIATGFPGLAEATFRDDMVAEHIMPLAEATAVEAAGLDAVAGQYCAGDTDMAALQEQFYAVQDKLTRMQLLGFGPAELFNRKFRLNFWPDDRNAVNRQLRSLRNNADKIEAADFDITKQSVAVQGLPALERLLFEDGPALPGTTDCTLTMAITANMAGVAEAIAADWQRVDIMPETGEDEFEQTIFSAVYTQFELIADRKIKRILGETPADARPEQAEARRSKASMGNVVAGLDYVSEIMLEAPSPWSEKLGAIDGWVPFVKGLEQVRATANRYATRPMADLVTDEAARRDLEEMVSEIKELRRIMAQDFAPALGLTIGFNSLDGD